MADPWPKHNWTKLGTPLAQKIQACLESWEGTPYHLNMGTKGVGTDCVHFVCGVADELQGSVTPFESIPGDASMHAPAKAQGVMRFLMKAYGARRVSDGTIEPGDVIICGPEGGGPGHAMIAGNCHIYHATGKKVQLTRFAPVKPHVVFHAILRIPDKETRWA